MSLSTYGIFIAYPPTVDLRKEGLGRYLASFLKGAANRTDVEFLILCPSWAREMLTELLSTEQVPLKHIQIISPKGEPYVLRLFEYYESYIAREKKPLWFRKASRVISDFRQKVARHFVTRLINTHSIATALPLALETSLVIFSVVTASPFIILVVFLGILWKSFLLVTARLLKPFLLYIEKIQKIIAVRQNSEWIFGLYNLMAKHESTRMLKLTQSLDHVKAWYCPTAFWPEFNKIRAPRLMCVPDVVLTEFPVGFSSVGGDRFLHTFETINFAIQGSDHLVTYSDSVKWNTLVDHCGIRAQDIEVIHHAPQLLSHWVEISNSSNDIENSKIYSQELLRKALSRSIYNSSYVRDIGNTEFKFIFYASQVRPNKNILSLLKAYEYLLRRRLIEHKLVITGSLGELPELVGFMKAHNLENDVLCLHGLEVSELAACYKLSELAVNPSLSEGGCPFTFTEALSVETPVVMSKISVTEEVLTDPELQKVTFFDPYDWKDMAGRIEWALDNRTHLLKIQKHTYQELIRRTWTDVANEHITVLDRISADASVVA